MHASELMTTDVASVSPEATRQEIARLLVARGISAVPVVDSNGTPLGMVSEGDLIRRGEPERQQRRDWWLEMLAEGETLSEDYVRQLGGREATARDLMSAPRSSWSRKAPTPRRSRPFSSRTGSNACLWCATGGWSASSAVRTCCGRSRRQCDSPDPGPHQGSDRPPHRRRWQRMLHQAREAAEHGVHDLICSSLHGARQP